jgi:hypothetical protein
MIKQVNALMESRKATLLAMAGALLLWLADGGTSVVLTNEFHIPAIWSIRLVSLSKLLLTLVAAGGASWVKPKPTDG